MPRIARIIPDEGAIHVVARRNNKRLLFRKERDFRCMMKLLAEYKRRFFCPVYHYALMPTHLHLVIGIEPQADISKMMHGICMRYATYYNKRYGLIGHFWQDRFKSFIVTNDEYLITCGIYIEKNPVEAGLVRRVEDYKWSSYHFYAFGKENSIVDMNPFYKSLSENSEERQLFYRNIMKGRLAETLVS